YSFFESFYYGTNLKTGQKVRGHHVVIIPTRPDGITGEILWPQYLCGVPTDDDGEDPVGTRIEGAFRLVERMLGAMRANDADAVAATFQSKAYVALRDITGPSGAAVACDSRAQIQEYFDRLFRVFEVVDIKVLNRISDTWYVFVDMLLELRRRDDPHSPAFEVRTAQTFGIGVDGELAGLVGY
ncbi:MAG: hypothetical protein JWL73_2609, partial [Actinomycetia bacterium]|nr:hypothetical protein [Actinomycetes bacterium]